MVARLVPCSRLPRVPLFAAAIVLGWGALVAIGHVLASRAGLSGADSSPCLFRRATGLPCPTCGGTRVVLRAGQGDVLWSFATNPGVFLAISVLVAALLLRVLAARRVSLGLSPRGRRVTLLVGIALVLANWAYVVVHGA